MLLWKVSVCLSDGIWDQLDKCLQLHSQPTGSISKGSPLLSSTGRSIYPQRPLEFHLHWWQIPFPTLVRHADCGSAYQGQRLSHFSLGGDIWPEGPWPYQNTAMASLGLGFPHDCLVMPRSWCIIVNCLTLYASWSLQEIWIYFTAQASSSTYVLPLTHLLSFISHQVYITCWCMHLSLKYPNSKVLLYTGVPEYSVYIQSMYLCILDIISCGRTEMMPARNPCCQAFSHGSGIQLQRGLYT